RRPGDPSRHGFQAGRHSAPVQPQHHAQPHGVRGLARAGEPAPPAAPVAGVRGRTGLARGDAAQLRRPDGKWAAERDQGARRAVPGTARGGIEEKEAAMAVDTIQAPIDELPPPIEGEAAWYGPDMARSSEWLYELDRAELAEIEAAMRPLVQREVEIGQMRKEDFPLPRLSKRIQEVTRDLLHGRGFAVMRGLPVNEWTMRESATAYFGIGLHMGNPRPQHARGHVLGHVRDLGRDAVNDPPARIYQTKERQTFHTDSTDVVGLLCLKTAKSGGKSALVSSMTIYNEM